jgi:hypothetical protein
VVCCRSALLLLRLLLLLLLLLKLLELLELLELKLGQRQQHKDSCGSYE